MCIMKYLFHVVLLIPKCQRKKFGYFQVNILSEIIITFLSVWLADFIVSSDLIISDLPCLNLIYLIARGTSTELNNTS